MSDYWKQRGRDGRPHNGTVGPEPDDSSHTMRPERAGVISLTAWRAKMRGKPGDNGDLHCATTEAARRYSVRRVVALMSEGV